MNKIYEKNKLTFALIWIGIYIIPASIADNLSTALGVSKIITAPVLFIMSLYLYFWISNNDLKAEYGLCSIKKHRDFLYYIPLLILVSANLWNGITVKLPVLEIVMFILSMISVGFLEEIIFRGFLFKSLCEIGIKKAFIISSVTFGFGHIINLISGAQVLPTILQIINATAIGFLFTTIFYKGKSLLPCIIAHGLFNSLSVFGIEASSGLDVIITAVLCIISVLYSVIILIKGENKNEKMY